MEKLFETCRKTSGKKASGNKTPGRRLSWALLFLRFLFNLVALILVVGTLVVVMGASPAPRR